MPPKKQYTKDQIVSAAFEIAKDSGIQGLTARKVAERLGSSVAPIYGNFADIAELKQAVAKKAFAIGRNMLNNRYTGDRFLDIGIAGIKFAKEYSVLFRELTLTPNEYMDDYQEELGDDVIGEMSGDPHLAGFTRDELMEILLKMRMFQLGLTVMVANGLLPPDFDEEAEIALLARTGADIMAAARLRKDFSMADRDNKMPTQGRGARHDRE